MIYSQGYIFIRMSTMKPNLSLMIQGVLQKDDFWDQEKTVLIENRPSREVFMV